MTTRDDIEKASKNPAVSLSQFEKIAYSWGTDRGLPEVPSVKQYQSHIEQLEHALAEKDTVIKRFQEVHDAIIDVLEGRPTEDEHTLVKSIQQQARELERVQAEVTVGQTRIDAMYRENDDLLRVAVRFTKMYKEETEYAYSQKELREGALSDDEDYQVAKAFLATPAVTALLKDKYD